MHRDCVEEIEKTIGRALKAEEEKAIEATITEEMRALARANPKAYMGMTQAQRMQAAAAQAQAQTLVQAARQKANAAAAVVAHSKLNSKFQTGMQSGNTGARTLAFMLNNVDIYARGVGREYFSNLVKTIETVQPRFFGLIEDARAIHAFATEVLDNASGKSGSKEMQAAARVWLDTIEGMRQRFNRAGGDIGQLVYGYLPQPHDIARVRAVVKDVWAAKVLPLLDRNRYVDPVTARPMSDTQVMDFLRHSYDTITTDGTNSLTPGQPAGYGARANRGSEHREIHFKDADSYLAYMGEFGKGSVFSAMQGHISGLSKNIGLVEEMGPNPEHMFKTFDDMSLQADRGVRHFGFAGVTNEQLWRTLSGKAGQVQHQRLADFSQNVRNVMVFGKLQGAFLSSITDLPTFFVTTRFNKLPVFEGFTNLVRALGQDSGMKEFANRSGLIADSLIGDMNRWAESNLRDNWTGKLSTATMKVSLLEGFTDALRRAFSVTMMAGLGKLSRIDWAALHADDKIRLTAKGVTPEDFTVWKLATPEQWRGSQMLTPEAIRAIPDQAFAGAGVKVSLDASGKVNPVDAARVRDQAASRLLGVILDESEYASIAPDLHARTLITWGGQERGTLGGELARSTMLFKGFPIAMMTRHWGRILSADMTPASRLQYAATLGVGLTVFGALAMQAKDMVSGKDPRDMTNPKFWGAAAAQGGGLGFAGDLIYQATGGMQSQGGVSTAANTISAVVGPVAGSIAELGDLTLGNLGQALKGKDTHFGAEAMRFARSHLPFVNLWYAKSALDHAFLNDMQEMLSPGYMARMQERVKRDWGQSYWWGPRETLPGRAPDLSAAGGH